ncbi:MAG: LTA synthase family protein [Sphingomonadaceae bacterium]|nr:LTA synthase family protein [Sphingomonadaceae bacterium]
MDNILILTGLFVGAVALDTMAMPRAEGRLSLRSAAGSVLLLLIMASVFGALLAVTGNPAGAVVLALALQALVTLASNAKHKVLGEPLVFSDLALVRAIFRHPQFYVDALLPWQKLVVGAGLLALPALLVALFRLDHQAHFSGLVLAFAGCLALRWLPSSKALACLTPEPDLMADVTRHGLLPVLVLYWWQWRRSAQPDPVPTLDYVPLPGEIVIVVQCESFADPQELFGDLATPLEGLDRARSKAVQWGNLLVDGFGAYTMRTEYGVLFGRAAAELGFRRFDPYLTALGDHSHALPARLAAAHWHRVFIHPHDLRFYGRDRVLGAAGFDRLVGPEAFAEPAGQYVPDAEIADAIAREIAEQSGAVLVFAVTIENHGPWTEGAGAALPTAYIDLLRKGDAMLSQLLDMLEQSGRPATLVFYGDHRPSIPGAVEPGPERHTPYVLVQVGHGQASPQSAAEQVDLTPAELHHAILRTLQARRVGPSQEVTPKSSGQNAVKQPDQSKRPGNDAVEA